MFAKTPAEYSDEFVLPDSDIRYYTEDDIMMWMTSDDARIARNEIFARYGRKFKDQGLKRYFESCSWYNGTIDPEEFDNNMDSRLNSCEKANIKVLKNLEEELKVLEAEEEEAAARGEFAKDAMKDRSGSTCYLPRYIREWTVEYVLYGPDSEFDEDDLMGKTLDYNEDEVLVMVYYRKGNGWKPYNRYVINRWTLTGHDYEGVEADVAPWNSSWDTAGHHQVKISDEDAANRYSLGSGSREIMTDETLCDMVMLHAAEVCEKTDYSDWEAERVNINTWGPFYADLDFTAETVKDQYRLVLHYRAQFYNNCGCSIDAIALTDYTAYKGGKEVTGDEVRKIFGITDFR